MESLTFWLNCGVPALQEKLFVLAPLQAESFPKQRGQGALVP